MTFSRGGHLMSNEKSFNFTKAPWNITREAMRKFMLLPPSLSLLLTASLSPSLPFLLGLVWNSAPRLDRVQSKLYPVAFGSEEPILLCSYRRRKGVFLNVFLFLFVRVTHTDHSPTTPCSLFSTSSSGGGTKIQASLISMVSRSFTLPQWRPWYYAISDHSCPPVSKGLLEHRSAIFNWPEHKIAIFRHLEHRICYF